MRQSSPRPSRALAVLVAFVAFALGVVLALAGCAGGTSSAGTASAGSARPATSALVPDGTALAPASATTDLPTVPLAALPPEALDTLELIAAGGPYPYRKDGATFGNREGLLPRQAGGFYREYTVETPGSDDRGARRIVAGADGSRFWTDDHYASFQEVVAS